jgi:xanthine dehydrogenase small subunit
MIPNQIQFILDNELVTIDFSHEGILPSTTVLNYLRSLDHHKGTKEGCAEGDCGACTVVLAELDSNNKLIYKAVDSCLLFLATIHGKQLITIENLAKKTNAGIQLHPVQQAIVDQHASQCGYCTPGIAMSVLALYKTKTPPKPENIQSALAGNLCRCTGYGSIMDAAKQALANPKSDQFTEKEAEVIIQLKKISEQTDIIDIHNTEQQYFIPKTLQQALYLRNSFSDAILVNGASDLAVRQNKTFVFEKAFLDLSHITELKNIKQEKQHYSLGAGLSIEDFKTFIHKYFREFSPILDHFASLQIRHQASIGGNICTASPIGDLIPVLSVLQAEIQIQSENNKRLVPLENFITGYRSIDLKSNELVTNIIIPTRDKSILFFAEKISTRRDVDISSLSISASLKYNSFGMIDDIQLIFGGLASTVKHAVHAENYLRGKIFNINTFEKAMNEIEIDFDPISDARSTTSYRLSAAQNLLIKAYDSFQSQITKMEQNGKN